MPEDRSLQTLIRQLGQRVFGSPGWAATMRQMLRFYLDPELRQAVPESDLRQVETAIERALTRDPAAVSPILVEAGFAMGEDEEGWQSNQDALLAAVESALGSAGAGLVSDIRETISQATQEETQQVRTEETRITGEAVTTEARYETEYVELPTADEFLDNFQNAIITHADTLHRAGDIGREARDFMVQSPEYFWDDYIAEMGRRAQAGEPLWRVVGLEGEPIRLGSRPGEAVREEMTTIETELREGTLRIEDIVERTINRLSQEAGTMDGGAVDRNLQQAITEQINRMFQQMSTETTTAERARTLVSLTVEEVIGRPQLARVYAYSPTDFLTERYTPTELMNVAAMVPGREAAERQAPRGIAPSAPRRLQ